MVETELRHLVLFEKNSTNTAISGSKIMMPGYSIAADVGAANASDKHFIVL